MKSATKNKRERVYHSFIDQPRPATITHFSKILSCENMCAIVTIRSNGKLSPVTFILGYACWLRQTVHGNIVRCLLTLLQYVNKHDIVFVGIFRVEFSVQMTMISHSATVGTVGMTDCPRHIRRLSPQRGWEFRIHVNRQCSFQERSLRTSQQCQKRVYIFDMMSKAKTSETSFEGRSANPKIT